jgi:predicted DNA-binding transcriptional regulator AlpA
MKLTLRPVIEAPRWIREKEASQIIGIALQTLRNWRHQRVGPPYSKVGRAVRYRLDELIDFMESKKIKV